MPTSSSNNKLTLRSNDKEIFEVEEIVAFESVTIKQMFEEDMNISTDAVIPIPNVTGKILSKVLLYCKKHVQTSKSADPAVDDDELKKPVEVSESADPTADDDELKKRVADELKAFDAEFLNVDQSTLCDIIMAANYLNIKGLLDLTCRAVADMIRGKTPEQIRETFNIVNDFTPEEEEEVRRENQWAFE